MPGDDARMALVECHMRLMHQRGRAQRRCRCTLVMILELEEQLFSEVQCNGLHFNLHLYALRRSNHPGGLPRTHYNLQLRRESLSEGEFLNLKLYLLQVLLRQKPGRGREGDGASNTTCLCCVWCVRRKSAQWLDLHP